MKKLLALLIVPLCFLGLIKKAKADSSEYEIRYDFTSLDMPVGGNVYDYLPECYVYNVYGDYEETRENMVYSYDYQGIKVSNINTRIAGNYFIYMSCYNTDYECPSYLQRINIHIYDDEAPTISMNDIISISYDSEFNLSNYLTYTDNAVTECSVVLEGNYKKKVGEYRLNVVVCDASNNYSEKSFTLAVYDRIKPTIISDDVIVIDYGSEFNPTDYIKAIDGYDGLIDFSVSDYDLNELGFKDITITAIDSSENTETKNIRLNVVDRVKPIIELKSHELNEEEDYDLASNIISVSDNFDELDINNILIEKKKVGTQRYLVNYSINDNSGNYTIEEVYINYTYKNKPIIEAINLDDLKEEFDPLYYVNCYDVEDGNLNDKVMVIYLDYDEKYGIYEVYDSDGNFTRERIDYVDRVDLEKYNEKEKIVFPTVEEENIENNNTTPTKTVNEYKSNNYNFVYYIVLGLFILGILIFIIVKHFKKKMV